MAVLIGSGTLCDTTKPKPVVGQEQCLLHVCGGEALEDALMRRLAHCRAQRRRGDKLRNGVRQGCRMIGGVGGAGVRAGHVRSLARRHRGGRPWPTLPMRCCIPKSSEMLCPDNCCGHANRLASNTSPRQGNAIRRLVSNRADVCAGRRYRAAARHRRMIPGSARPASSAARCSFDQGQALRAHR